MKKYGIILSLLLSSVFTTSNTYASPIEWVDWTSAVNGTSGSASGEMNTSNGLINVQYAGEIWSAQRQHLIQHIGGQRATQHLIQVTV